MTDHEKELLLAGVDARVRLDVAIRAFQDIIAVLGRALDDLALEGPLEMRMLDAQNAVRRAYDEGVADVRARLKEQG